MIVLMNITWRPSQDSFGNLFLWILVLLAVSCEVCRFGPPDTHLRFSVSEDWSLPTVKCQILQTFQCAHYCYSIEEEVSFLSVHLLFGESAVVTVQRCVLWCEHFDSPAELDFSPFWRDLEKVDADWLGVRQVNADWLRGR